MIDGRVRIREHMLALDIRRELDRYEWRGRIDREDKLLACSPFRDDRNPSFAVRLDNGVWVDKGSTSRDWYKGNLVRLLSFLRGETETETEDYLLQTYDTSFADADDLQLDLSLQLDRDEQEVTLPSSLLLPLNWRSPYLGSRGISEEIQQLFRIGYDRGRQAVSIPWFNRDGQLVNIKYRSVRDKRFWYHAGGDRIRNHVYGMQIIQARRIRRVYVTEAEIDALYLWACGYPAVALGSANLTARQREIFIQSPAEEIVAATDNDEAGDHAAEILYEELNGYASVSRLQLPPTVKDVNELSPIVLSAVAEAPADFNLIRMSV